MPPRPTPLLPAPPAPPSTKFPGIVLGPEGVTLAPVGSPVELRLRALLQADERFYPQLAQDPPPPNGQFVVRRARLYLDGTVANFVDFKLIPDFGLGGVTLEAAWVDLRFASWIKLRFGKFKVPFGIEKLENEQHLFLVERGLPNNLVPDRDIGVSLHGDLGDGTFLYELAVMNGTFDGSAVDGDVDGAKDLIARFYFNPLRPTRVLALRDLGFGIAATAGDQTGSTINPFLPTYRSDGQQVIFTYLTDPLIPTNSVLASGLHARLSPQLFEAMGPVGLMAEYVWSVQNVSKGAEHARLIHQAWQAILSLVLTGERPGYDGVRPLHDVNPRKGYWGAFELTLRYDSLTLDNTSFPVYADPAKSVRGAEGLTAGLNWYFSRNAKFVINFEKARFTGGAAGANRPEETDLFGRMQVGF